MPEANLFYVNAPYGDFGAYLMNADGGCTRSPRISRCSRHDDERKLSRNIWPLRAALRSLRRSSEFGLDHKETERLFGSLDEDYLISRFLHFSQVSGPAYSINGFDQTHISIDQEIQSVF